MSLATMGRAVLIGTAALSLLVACAPRKSWDQALAEHNAEMRARDAEEKAWIASYNPNSLITPDLQRQYDEMVQADQQAEAHQIREFGRHAVYLCKSQGLPPVQYAYCLAAHEGR